MAATAHGGDKVDIWVVLSEPPVVSGTAPEAVEKQQQAVMAQLRALGAVELGRVSMVRNAIAVSIDQARLPEVRKVSGVRSVSPVRDIRRDPVPGPTTIR